MLFFQEVIQQEVIWMYYNEIKAVLRYLLMYSYCFIENDVYYI